MSKLLSFKNQKILVVGDVMLDTNCFGTINRISPEAPVPILHVSKEIFSPGGAGNVAMNLSSLGAQTHIMGVVGADENAKTLRSIFKKNKVKAFLQTSYKNTTINKYRVMSENQHLLRIDHERKIKDFNKIKFRNQFLKILPNIDLVIFSDYAKGTLEDIEFLINKSKKEGLKVIIDPKGNCYQKYKGADLITPNLKEFQDAVGISTNLKEIEKKGINLCKKLDIKSILITLGENGMAFTSKDNEFFHIDTDAKEVFDVTGAGDTVIAALSAAYSQNIDIRECIKISNIAAGIAVSKIGTTNISIDDLNNKIQNIFVKSSNKILTRKALIKKLLSVSKKIVFTNGCFDILHPGHIKYLEQAKELGDLLIVGVNDDKSVQRLKGKNRPINKLVHRMKMLASLSSVDFVVSFSESTPLKLIKDINPNVLVKGGDYRLDQIIGAREVIKKGGHVRRLEFVDGYSTTKIIESLKDNDRV